MGDNPRHPHFPLFFFSFFSSPFLPIDHAVSVVASARLPRLHPVLTFAAICQPPAPSRPGLTVTAACPHAASGCTTVAKCIDQSGQSAQQMFAWRPDPAVPGAHNLELKSTGTCLDIFGHGTEQGAPIDIWECLRLATEVRGRPPGHPPTDPSLSFSLPHSISFALSHSISLPRLCLSPPPCSFLPLPVLFPFWLRPTSRAVAE